MDGFATASFTSSTLRLDSCAHSNRRPAASRTHTAKPLLAAVTALLFASGVATAQSNEVRVQGNWAYTERGRPNAEEHLATTSAVEGNVWLILACSGDEKLTVSLIHDTQFDFPLQASSPIELRSKDIPAVPVEGRSAEPNQIILDPRLMRHVIPSIIEEDQLVISVPEAAGPIHDYTFAMQPNDVALRAIRSHCFND
ncbi:MAG: hypothetical protein K2Z80_09735 [Xanthobacteraceae bacterium]|nr:hypothetical protein [Xanthobacteraceae bacterium]